MERAKVFDLLEYLEERQKETIQKIRKLYREGERVYETQIAYFNGKLTAMNEIVDKLLED